MKRVALAALLLLIVLQVSGWAQCAMCRTALESSPEGQALAGSFRHGILLLIGAPYLMIGATSYAIFRAYKKKQANLKSEIRNIESDRPI